MEEKDATPKEEPEEVKSQWQLQKENWYDRVPLTVKQLDKIIATCLVLLALGQWSLFLSAESIVWQALLLIPAAARACAGLAVLGLRPMDTSQYAAMGASRGGYLAALAVLLVLAAGLPLWLWGSFAPLAAAAGYGLAVWYGYRNLDGMSGDISGFALTLGELCGCAAAILWR